MLLNGGRLNAQVINGTRRLPVGAAATAVLGLASEGSGRVEVRGQGVVDVTLGSDLRLRALRYATGVAAITTVDTALTGARHRVGGGHPYLTSVHADPLAYQIYRRASGAVPIELSIAVDPRIFRGADVQSFVRLQAELAPSAQRFAQLDAELTTQAQLSLSAYRVGAIAPWAGSLGLLASLYYARTQYGNGSAIIDLSARADVGVIFIAGSADLRPMETDLVPTRRRWAPAFAVVETQGALEPSAIRRPRASVAIPLWVSGALDPAHITEQGVRYITPDARLDVPLEMTDAGMLRQLTAASFAQLGCTITATGAGQRGVTPDTGFSATALLAQMDLTPTRRFPISPVVLTLHGEGEGEVFVRGEGQATVRLVGACQGGAIRRSGGQASCATLATDLGGLRRRTGSSDMAPLTWTTELAGLRCRVGSGEAAMSVQIRDTDSAVIREIGGGFSVRLEAAFEGDVFSRGDGEAGVALAVSQVGQVTRHIAGAITTQLAAAGTGDVLVRGGGRAIFGLGAVLDGLRTAAFDGEAAFGMGVTGKGYSVALLDGEAELVLDSTGDGCRRLPVADLGVIATELVARFDQVRWLIRLPELDTAFKATGGGVRLKSFEATGVIDVLGESGAYINIASEDVDAQTFVRPADVRGFVRPPETRQFQRTA